MKNLVFAIMVILGVLLVVTDIGVTILLLTNVSQENVDKIIEGTIMTNGLTIITLAITVWMGISIYNAIGKNEIEELKTTLEKYSPLSEQVKEYTKQQLVNQMYRLGDISCDYLAKCFEKNEDIPMERYADLLVIDILLQNVYEARTDDVKEQRINWAYVGIEKINKYKGKFKKQCELEKIYLNYREADFWFFIAGSCKEKEKISAYKKAKNIYVKAVRDFEIPLTLEEQNIATVDDEKKKIAAYFANAIAQCSANIINENMRKEECEKLREETKRYYEFALENAKDGVEREVYYRNYGCFIENTACDSKDMEKAYEEYKKAFSLGPREHNVYHVLISNLNKRIRSELAIEMRTPQNNRNISLFEQSFNISDNKEKALGLIDEMEIYIAMAIKKFPDEPQWYAFSIYRKIYKICMKNASDVNVWKKNLKSLKKDATRIEILKGKQALCAVAKAEVADIEEYCSKN